MDCSAGPQLRSAARCRCVPHASSRQPSGPAAWAASRRLTELTGVAATGQPGAACSARCPDRAAGATPRDEQAECAALPRGLVRPARRIAGSALPAGHSGRAACRPNARARTGPRAACWLGPGARPRPRTCALGISARAAGLVSAGILAGRGCRAACLHRDRVRGRPAGRPDRDAVILLPLGGMGWALGMGGGSCWVIAQAGAPAAGALRSQQLAVFLTRAAPHSVDLVCCQRVPQALLPHLAACAD
jgi:hypothetical protein